MATELLDGLAELGHQIDCFFPGSARPGVKIAARFAERENPTFIWGEAGWRWDRWYSRTKITAFVSGLVARAVGSVRLRREIARRHRREPYDLIFQNSTIESLAVPPGIVRRIPLVIRPDTHIAGELRWLLAERRLAFACQPRRIFFITAAVMSVRTLVQRVRIRRASLLICISRVFRDHLVGDYGFPVEDTVVVPNPVAIDRFAECDVRRPLIQPPTVLVLGRISARKGLEDVVAVARLMREREPDARVRIVGGPSLWSDYSKLLDDLPRENSEFIGRIRPAEIPAELGRADVLLQASRYEPFGMTVGEALAAGVPVVATSEVGAIEQVDRSVVAEVVPGDTEGLAAAVADMLERLREDAPGIRSKARAEAARLFAPEVVCRQVSDALQALAASAACGGA